LLRPEQLVSEMPDDKMVVTVQGSRPAMLQKVRYYADVEFSGLWDADSRKEGLPAAIPPAWYEKETDQTDEIPPAMPGRRYGSSSLSNLTKNGSETEITMRFLSNI
jgi:type IV secretory pathway TraG/TraD family ATPase VirD4